MISLKNEAEIYRVGLIIGYFVKDDVIRWADKIIETQENYPYEIIEVSLLGNSSKPDIASKLSEITGIANHELILCVLFGLCSNSYKTNKFTADEICTLLYRLVSTKTDISMSQEIEQKIHYLSDGYYLASEGIYGNLKDICDDLKEFLDRYEAYAKEFSPYL